jgi:hypothetical protein
MMDGKYSLRIVNSYTPDTLPLNRLAEYMEALSRLFSEPKEVHFDSVVAGSAVLKVKIDDPARAKVAARIIGLRDDTAPKEAIKAFADIDALLRKDGANGELIGDGGAVILRFPGITRPEPLEFGPFKQDGTLEGIVIRVGGKDDTIPIHLKDGDVVHCLDATPELAKRIAHHYLSDTLRVNGTGTWFREANGTWLLKRFKISEFEVLSETPLMNVVESLRKVQGSTWNEVPNAIRSLLEDRYDNGGTN